MRRTRAQSQTVTDHGDNEKNNEDYKDDALHIARFDGANNKKSNIAAAATRSANGVSDNASRKGSLNNMCLTVRADAGRTAAGTRVRGDTARDQPAALLQRKVMEDDAPLSRPRRRAKTSTCSWGRRSARATRRWCVR